MKCISRLDISDIETKTGHVCKIHWLTNNRKSVVERNLDSHGNYMSQAYSRFRWLGHPKLRTKPPTELLKSEHSASLSTRLEQYLLLI